MSLPQPRLLVVDDDRLQCAVVAATLGAAGWSVDQATDGAAAIRAVATVRYALILLDLELPPPDGFAIARTLRGADSPDRTVPILAFSALATGNLAERLATAGFDGHVAKSEHAVTLAERVAPWRPRPPDPVRARLAEAFGADALAALVGRFGVQLADALDRIDDPDAVGRAHRIAGLAGTLGFADIHHAWLAVSEGDRGARTAAATVARRVLRTL